MAPPKSIAANILRRLGRETVVTMWVKCAAEGAAAKNRAAALLENGVLNVKTTRDGLTTTENYSLTGDGMLLLVGERQNHQTETLLFQRQR